MLSGKKLVNDTGEKAFSGYDVKFSGQAPYLPWAKIKGTYYHWDTISGPDLLILALKLVRWYSKPRLRRLCLDLVS
jgi:hypothetical protein